MTRLRCTLCEWTQDHFWDQTLHNPIKNLLSLEKDLLEKDLDEIVKGDNEGKRPPLPRRTLIAMLMQKASSKVLSMKWRTYDEWKNDPHPYCPQCDAELELHGTDSELGD